jgi:hypothetical protein
MFLRPVAQSGHPLRVLKTSTPVLDFSTTGSAPVSKWLNSGRDYWTTDCNSHPMRLRIFPIILTIALLGCAKERAPDEPPVVQKSGHAQSGTLSENLALVAKGDFRSDCDVRLDPIREKLVGALEARSSAIAAASKEKSADSSYTTVTFGPTLARELNQNTAPAPGWTLEAAGWDDLLLWYEKIMDKPVDASWVRLQIAVIALLEDDKYRVGGYNFQLDKDSGPKLEALLKGISTCLDREDCRQLTLSPESEAFVQTQWLYSHWMKRLAGKPEGERRDYLKKIKTAVQSDYSAYEFKKNPGVKRTSPGHYELELDLGPFAGAEEQFVKYFEQSWKAPDSAVKLKTKDYGTNAFKVLLGTELGGRSFVHSGNREVHLMPLVRDKTLAHELGHVLGFFDTYYSIFNPVDCTWKSQYSEEDLMSELATGRVLPLHWEKLAEIYQ